MNEREEHERSTGSEFERAVHSERQAIKQHEAAAERQAAAAAALEKHADRDNNPLSRQRTSDQAAKAYARAEHARQRAEHIRNRLREEGVDPDN